MSISTRSAIFFLTTIGLLLGCSTEPNEIVRSKRTAADGALYGGLLRMNVTDEIRSIFPHNIVDAAAFNIMNQVYEGLVAVDRDTREVVPALAERYEISPDGKVYRFYLREGVRFHSDPVFGEAQTRELSAEDVAFCLRKLCEPAESNQLYAFVIDVIKGARSHYDSLNEGETSATGPVGIRVPAEGVVEIELEFAMPNFLTVLTHPCCWIFPKELYSYGKEMNNWSIGTGPFKARIMKINDVIILERNGFYWKTDGEGNQLPYLDAIRCNFEQSHREQMSALLAGNLDLLVQVPQGRMANIARLQAAHDESEIGFDILTAPGLRTEYYGFQHRSALYGDEQVRMAFNYAIDRQFLVDSVLMGYGTAAHHGIVPVGMPGYPAQGVKGFKFNPDSARILLALAGYPGGNGFPVVTLQLNDGNETALKVADAMQKMLTEVLGLTVEQAVLPRSRHYDLVENGSVGFWRDGWIADYPDPENFLKLFHGKLVPDDAEKASYLNSIRFQNEAFDAFFEAALREQDKNKRMELFRKADQEIINHAAVIPLYYEKWIWLKSEKVHNLSVGSMGDLDLKKVYLKKVDNATPASL